MALGVALMCSLIGFAQSKRSNELFAKGVELYKQGRYDQAMSIFKKMRSIDAQEMDTLSNRFVYGNLWIASCLYHLGREEEAKTIDNMQYYLAPPVDRRLTIQSDSLASVAVALFNSGKYTEAVNIYSTCAAIEKQVLGENSLWSANTLCAQGEAYAMMHENLFASAYLSKGIAIIQKQLGNGFRFYWHLRILALIIPFQDDENASDLSLAKLALSLCNTFEDKESKEDLEKNFLNRSLHYNKYSEELLPIVEGYDSLEFAVRVGLVEVYENENEQANEHLLEKKINNWERLAVLTKEIPQFRLVYFRAMTELAYAYNDERTIRISKELVDYFIQNPPTTSIDTASFINICILYSSALSSIGKDEESVVWMTKAVDLEEQYSGRTSYRFITSVCRMMSKIMSLNGKSKYMDIASKYLYIDDILVEKLNKGELYKRNINGVNPYIFYKDLVSYFFCMEMMASHLKVVSGVTDKDYRPKSFEGVRNIILQEYGENSPLYKHFNMTIFPLYVAEGKFNEAYQYIKDLTLDGISGFKATCCIGMKDEDRAYTYIRQYIEEQRNNTIKRFKWMTSEERSSYWKKNMINSFESLSVTAGMYRRFAPLFYDLTLFSKGLLLSMEMELRDILKKQGDRSIISIYNTWVNTKISIDKISDTDALYDEKELLRLTQVADSLERELTLKSKEFGDFSNQLTYTHKDIQRNLKGNDIAIEFNTYLDKDTTKYYALVLTKDTVYMELLPMESTLVAEANDAYTAEKFSKLLFTPLERYFHQDANIYFSAAGLLHKVAIESLSAVECYNMYRLSTTRELVSHKYKSAHSAILYGGLNYSNTEDTYLASSGNSLRGAMDEIEYLPGSAEEIKGVEALLKPHISVSCMSGDAGTEGNFKELSEKDISILHISTHGFYNDIEKQQGVSQEDLALSRSGLYLSGASDHLYGSEDKGTDMSDDGILTAKEISRLDLSAVDMVVLSACETGLGDITGDGVFGLQRGFKKAGANSMLMSLWKVDDDATCLLMTEFYKNWIGEGKTKHDALELAKKAVRSHKEKGWDDPKYWAAFILLDALD